MVDNFDLIKSLLKFESKDDFYYLQIIQRSKDNPDIGANNRLVRSYCIRSLEYFKGKKKEIKQMCSIFKARAYIHLNKRSYKDVALVCLQNLAERIRCDQMEEVYRCYDHACGSTCNKDDKTWVVDIDGPIDNRAVNNILLFIERECRPVGPKFRALIPTKNGFHLIVTPFDMSVFGKQYPDIDVHKNNPTLLYYSE
jgi:hypothetical protein